MPPTPSRLRRGALRTIVLLQLLAVVLVAYTVGELVVYGSLVTPGAVWLVAIMLAATVLALRATFALPLKTRDHQLAFMGAQAVVAVAPLLGYASLGFVTHDSLLPPDGGYGPSFATSVMGLWLLAATILACLSALLAPLLLAAPSEPKGASRSPRQFGVWAGAGALATVLVGILYGFHFAEAQKPQAHLKELFGDGDMDVHVYAAKQLIAADLKSQPEISSALYEGLAAPNKIDQSWAAYVLVASGADDGRAMKHLREMLQTDAVANAVQTLAMLGPDAAPALADLMALIEHPAKDSHDAEIKSDATDALGQIGAPAIGAVPLLLELARAGEYSQLRYGAGRAIDRLDPGFAKRCVIAKPESVVDAIAMITPAPLPIRSECLPAGSAPAPSDTNAATH